MSLKVNLKIPDWFLTVEDLLASSDHWFVVCFQSVVDLEQQMLVFGTGVREQVDFVKKPLGER